MSISQRFHCRFVTEQGEHLNYEHQRFYLNCTAHGGGVNHSPTNLELLFYDFRKMLPHLTVDGKTEYTAWLEEEKENNQRYFGQTSLSLAIIN